MTKRKKHSKKKRSPLPWIAGILFLLAAAVAAGLYWNGASRINKVEFRGNKYISIEQLKNRVDIPIGISPDSLNYGAIIHQIKQIPYVENVHLKVQPGGSMIVSIQERKPLALLVKGADRCLVDRNGIKLKLQEQIPDVPILYGFNVEPMSDTLSSNAFKKVSSFLQKLSQNPVADATVSAVAWQPKEGVIAMTNSGEVKLIFGDKQFGKKLRNWKAFYAQVIRYKGLNHFKSVNMKFDKQIITHE